MQIRPDNASTIAPPNKLDGQPIGASLVIKPLDQAREYLAKVLPWSQDGNADTYINIHFTIRKPGYDKPFWRGKPCRSLDEAIKELDWLVKQADVQDIYVCMSSQREAETKVSPKTGKKFTVAVRSQENAVALKSLFLDIDAKGTDKNSYASLNDAVAGLSNFLKASALPKPSLVVSSGGGLHCYWTLAHSLTPDEWRPLAFALVEATVRHGLKCDTVVTTDCARVLRIPNTFNRKTETPRPVRLAGKRLDFDYSVERMAQALEPYKVAVPVAAAPKLILDPALFPRRAPITGESELSAGIETAMPQDQIKACLDAIPNTKTDWNLWNSMGMRVYAASHGAQYGLDEWKAWSAKNNSASNSDNCDDRWAMYDTSPPTRTGAGALVNEARSALNDPTWMPCAIPAQVTQQVTANAPPTHVGPPLTAVPLPGFGAAQSFRHGLRVSFSNIPHRRWLYGVDLLRGEITFIASPGGIGKSSLAIGMAVCLATGRRLLDEKIWGDELTALYVNAEDAQAEMRRRIHAFCLQHNVTEQELDRFLLLAADDWRVQRLSFLRSERSASVVNGECITHLEEMLEALRPDLLVLDPLVALCGGGDMNSNGAMALVIRELKRLAIKFDCAVLILHHTNKGADLNTADAITGASAMVNLCRRANMAVPMTSREADHYGVLPSERTDYFKLVAAKSNLARRSPDAPWYQLHSVVLPNPELPIYPYGDGVQAVTRVNLTPVNKSSPTAEDLAIKQAVIEIVEAGKMIDGVSVPYSPSVTGAQNLRSLLDDAIAAAQGNITQQRSPEDMRAIVKRCIRSLQSEGVLVQEKIVDGRFRGGQGLCVDRSRAPAGQSEESGGEGYIEAEGSCGAMGQCNEE